MRPWSASPTRGSASAIACASCPSRSRAWSSTRRAFLKGQVADYKLPEVIETFEELPMTGTGKIRRHILREQVEKRLAQSS